MKNKATRMKLRIKWQCKPNLRVFVIKKFLQIFNNLKEVPNGFAHAKKSLRKKTGLLPSRLYCRLRNYTSSACARGLIQRITAGREFHPAPKTL